MRNSTHVGFSPVIGSGCAGGQRTYAALSELNAALRRAGDSSRSSHMLTYQARSELMQCTSALKATICAAGDEQVYDLATLIDLLTVAALGVEHKQEEDGLELMQRAIELLQRQFADNAASERECTQMMNEIWTWLGSSRCLSARC